MAILLHAPLRQGLENYGSEMVTNGTMEGGATPPTGWSNIGTGVGTSATDPYAGTYSLNTTGCTANANLVAQSGIVTTAGRAYVFSGYMKKVSGGYGSLFLRSGSTPTSGTKLVEFTESGTSWAGKSQLARADAATVSIGIGASLAGDIARTDNVSVLEYWLTDLSASARHLSPAAILSGKWTTLTSGLTVLYFNGTTDLLDLGTDFLGTGNLTVKFWMRPDTAGEGSVGRIISNGKFAIATNYTVISATSNDWAGIANSASLTFGNWYHCVVTRTSAGVANIYLNGALSGTANQDSGSPTAASTNVFVGNRSAADYTFNGLLSEIVVEDSIWSAADALANYTNERPLYDSTVAIPSSYGNSDASVTARGTLNSANTAAVTGLIGGY